MHELFRDKAPKPMPLEKERELIAQAQAGVPYSAAAQWDLLRQYRGALQSASFKVRTRVRGMTEEQIEELQSDLVLAALDAIRDFDLEKHIRLGQVLPKTLARVVANRQEALTVPARVLGRWSKILREAGGDHDKAAELAPAMRMESDTFRAIHHALDFSTEEWSRVPYDASAKPTADADSHALAHGALARLKPDEREILELAYGFRGDPKSDAEVADIVGAPREAVKKRRVRALEKIRGTL